MTDPETPDPALLANPLALMDATMQAAVQAPAAAVLGQPDAGGQQTPPGSPAPPGDPATVLSQVATGARAQALAQPLTDADKALVVQQISRLESVASKPYVISADAEDMVIDLVEQVAAARGVAPPLQLRYLTVHLLKGSQPDEELASSGRATDDDWYALWLAEDVWAAVLEVVATVSDEWQQLQDQPVGQSFENEAAQKKTDPFEYYQKIRSFMYVQGWANPFTGADPFTDFWTKVVPATLCGVNITYGVHEKFLQALKGNGSNPDLTQPSPIWQPAKADILGFQPRVVREGPKLSNHAFGLAIDINPAQNAIVDNPTEIRIIRDHTSQHIDLGKALNKAALPALVAEVQQAAHDFQGWLKAAVPREQTLRQAREAAGENLRNALATGDQPAIASAQKAYDAAVAAYDNDPLVPADVAALRAIIGDTGISEWEKNGFLNLPLALVDALSARFTWGGAYVKLKDFMHFEIDVADVFGNL
jgi:hypothetical protein